MHSTPAQGSLDPSPPADYPGCPVTVEVALSQGRVLRSPRWGLGDVFIMLGATVLVGLVASSLIDGAGATLGVTVIIGGLLS